ncbi:MAG: heme exporter protein CcmD [Rhodospirillaceae bacterium]|jgi:heme exporter protein D|nr:heme exporter protein CcmD [Rhodospirillaceae bacterium]|tara:strand:+ start:568 stop:747 length:180 start_codon:yes stop_codon:yes gene_type:complete
MNDFFDMGGYGAFIWPAYLVTFIILGGILAQSVVTMRRRERLADVLRKRRRDGLDDNEV